MTPLEVHRAGTGMHLALGNEAILTEQLENIRLMSAKRLAS